MGASASLGQPGYWLLLLLLLLRMMLHYPTHILYPKGFPDMFRHFRCQFTRPQQFQVLAPAGRASRHMTHAFLAAGVGCARHCPQLKASLPCITQLKQVERLPASPWARVIQLPQAQGFRPGLARQEEQLATSSGLVASLPQCVRQAQPGLPSATQVRQAWISGGLLVRAPESRHV